MRATPEIVYQPLDPTTIGRIIRRDLSLIAAGTEGVLGDEELDWKTSCCCRAFGIWDLENTLASAAKLDIPLTRNLIGGARRFAGTYSDPSRLLSDRCALISTDSRN